MASAKQACEAIDAALRLPPNTVRWRADRLRTAGLLPATPGRPVDISTRDIITLMVAVFVSPGLTGDYLQMPCTTTRCDFGEALALFVANPVDLFEIVIDCNSPAAIITYRAPHHGIETLNFESRERQRRPAFEKQVRIGPSVFFELAAAIKSAPPVRVGRRSLKEQYA